MKKLDRITLIATKVAEVCHWVAAALMVAALVCSIFAPSQVGRFVGYSLSEDGAELSVYGFDVVAPIVDGMADTTMFVIFSVGAIVMISLMAMTFRNLNLILKAAQKTTPFQKDNVRMLKEIGIFLLSVPLVGFAAGWTIRLVCGVDAAEISNNIGSYFVMALVSFSLTSFFSRGIQLESDMDGLV